VDFTPRQRLSIAPPLAQRTDNRFDFRQFRHGYSLNISPTLRPS
jgi:hypothetical protein